MGWIFLAIILILSVVVQKGIELRKVEEKREDDRLAKLKALYPDPPTYEERMDVQYGSTGPQDTSGE